MNLSVIKVRGTEGYSLIPRVAAVLVVVSLSSLTVGCASGPGPEDLVSNDYSLRLDGDDDYLDLGMISPGDPLMLAGSPFTISAWFRQESGGDRYQRIIDKSDEALGRNGWALGADPNAGMIHFYVHDGTKGADFASRRGLYTTGEWHHLVAVARADGYEIWLDGERDDGTWFESGSFALPANVATTARIGTWNHAPEREWDGRLDEIAVWKVDLDRKAIEAIRATRGRADLRRNWGHYGAADHLVGYWRMGDGPDDGQENRIHDLSSSGNHGVRMPPPPDDAPVIEPSTVR
jgi:hypothetical protein